MPDAATADPLSDSQLERVVRLALGKRVPATVETGRAVVVHAAAAAAGGGEASRTPAAAAEFTRGHQTKRRLEPEDESENRSPEPTGAGESSSEADEARNAPPDQRRTAARVPPETPTALSENTTPSNEATAKAKKKKTGTEQLRQLLVRL
jgi:hypothetical protein